MGAGISSKMRPPTAVRSGLIRASGKLDRRRGSVLTGPVCLVLVCVLGACSRPTGDFDRAAPSVFHDKVMAGAGEGVARLRKEPVSKFNMTDDEKLLRTQAWALIRPPWTKDWIGGTLVEFTRTRLLPEAQGKVPPDLYYIYLSSDKFQSSDARYDRVATDATGDAELVPPFCEVATRVKNADQERLRALSAKPVAAEEMYKGAKARVWENRMMISWVGQALRYRIEAYQRALENLEVETPTGDRMWKVNTSIRKLEAAVRLAEEGCEVEDRYVEDNGERRRSRIFTSWGLERPPPVK